MSRHRILVTGLHGFVGSALSRRLKRQFLEEKMELISLDTPDGEPVDIRDRILVNKTVARLRPTCLIHLAAIASPRDAATDPGEAWSVNVNGTFHLANAVKEYAPTARFVFASSSEIYGESFANAGSPLDETAALHPLSVYGATKAAADLMLEQMAREGLRATRFRPFNHTGAGQTAHYVASAFARQIVRIEEGLQEPVMMVGNLEAKRDFLDVSDVVDAYLRAAMSDNETGIGAFNLATSKPIRVGDLLEILIGLSQARIEIRQDPARMRANEIAVVSGNAARAYSVFGWKAETSLEETLSALLHHWRILAIEQPEHLS